MLLVMQTNTHVHVLYHTDRPQVTVRRGICSLTTLAVPVRVFIRKEDAMCVEVRLLQM